MMQIQDYDNEADWLEARKEFITASDAANYCNVNAYDPNGATNLWLAKTGIKPRPYIGDKPQVIMGNKAEDPVRQLFMLQHPEFTLIYNEYGLYVNDKTPWAAATLDGLLVDNITGDLYIYEGKTTTVRNKEGFKQWYDNGVPVNYIAQGSHQLMVVEEAKGIFFFCWQMIGWDMDSNLLERYKSREEMESNIETCRVMGQEMANNIEKGIRPIQKFIL